MPRKARFTREDFINTTLEIIDNESVGSVTAREIGDRMGSSSRPLFTFFDSVNDLKLAALEEIRKDLVVRLRKASAESVTDKILLPEFKAILDYSESAPRRWDFLVSNTEVFGSVISETALRTIQRVKDALNLDDISAKFYFENMLAAIVPLTRKTPAAPDNFTESSSNSAAVKLTAIGLSLCLSLKEIPGFAEKKYDAQSLASSIAALRMPTGGRPSFMSQPRGRSFESWID